MGVWKGCGVTSFFFHKNVIKVERKQLPRANEKGNVAKKLKKLKCRAFRNPCGVAGNSISTTELRKKIATFRDLLDLPPCNDSCSINKLVIQTLKDLQRSYPNVKASLPVSKLEGASLVEVFNLFCMALQSLGDLWANGNEWMESYKHNTYNKSDLYDLEQLVLEMLRDLNKLARGRLFVTMDHNDQNEPTGDCNQSSNAFEKALSESRSHSDNKSPVFGSPPTPTSVLPEIKHVISDGTKISYSPSLILPLTVQSIGKLNPIDAKRLSFHMFPHVVVQDPKLVIQISKIVREQELITETKYDSQVKQLDENEVQSQDCEILVDIPKVQLRPYIEEVIDIDENISEISPPLAEFEDLQPFVATEITPIPPPSSLSLQTNEVEIRIAIPPPPPLPPLPKQLPSPIVSTETKIFVPPPPPPLPMPSFTTRNAIFSPHPLSPITLLEVTPGSMEMTSSSPPLSPPPPPSKMASPLPPLSKMASPPPLAPQSKMASPPPPPPPSKMASPSPLPPLSKTTSPPPPPLPPMASSNRAPQPPPPPTGSSNMVPPPPPPPMERRNGASPPPPTPAAAKGMAHPPPPPSLAGSLRLKKATTKLKRSSQMGNLYRLVKRKVEGSNVNRKSQRKSGQIGGLTAHGKQGMADALAEMTKRSSYFQQIEEDVKIHAKAINEVKVAINTFQTSDMAALIKFHKYVESQLEKLTDESQVLARFEDFPMKKLEALRMAVSLYSKLDAIATTLLNWEIVSPVTQVLDKVESYFNKIKGDLEALERVKDEEAKKFKNYKIDFDFSILVRIKELMVDVSSSCTELVLKETREAKAAKETTGGSKTDVKKTGSDQMLWKAFQFAYRVYTFAGGHDDRAERLTKELAQEIEINPHL